MLKATDRCDGCGAQAWVQTEINGTDMLWCVHHWRKWEQGIVAKASAINDFSFLLEES
jgi:hypothetical protein